MLENSTSMIIDANCLTAYKVGEENLEPQIDILVKKIKNYIREVKQNI